MWAKNGLVLLGIFLLGLWFGSGHAVRASSYDSGQGLQFQVTGGIEPSSSLLVYHAETKTVYLYQGAMLGNSALQCTYKFQIDKPGEVIRRIPCGIRKTDP